MSIIDLFNFVLRHVVLAERIYKVTGLKQTISQVNIITEIKIKKKNHVIYHH